MIRSRSCIPVDPKNLADLVGKDMDKDEAMQVVIGLRKLRMPQQFYNTLADALSSTKAEQYSEWLDIWNPLVKIKLKRLRG